MKFFYLCIVILFSQSQFAQRVTLYTASGSAGIQNMCYDDQGNRYVMGYYSGRAYFTDKLPDVSSAHYYLAKMTPDNQMVWVNPITDEKHRWEMSVQNNQLCVLASYYDNDFDANKYIRTMHLEKYSLDGALISNTELATSDNHDIFISSYAEDNGIILEVTVKGDANDFQLRGKSYTKKRYSAVIFYKFGYDGNQQWECKIEGGYNGFTDLRIGDIALDKQGNLYVGSYYAHSADLGVASFTTGIAFKGPIDLYNNAAFVMQIDNTGRPVGAVSIADYDFTIENLVVNEAGELYVGAYYKGSDAYEKANPSEGNYKAALLFGEPLPDTKSGDAGITEPSEDAVIVKLDNHFLPVWKQFVHSNEFERTKSMFLIRDTLHICAMAGGVAKIGDMQVTLLSDGYGDGFYAALDAKTGNVLKVNGFTAAKSNGGTLYPDKKGNLLMISGFVSPVTIDGVEYQTKGSISTSFIYEFNVKPGSTSPVATTTNSSNNSSTVTSGTYSVGDHVRCDWKGYGKYYAAVVTQISGEKYLVKYTSDGSEEWTTAQYLKIPEKGVFRVGDEIEGNWKGGGTWYAGKIEKIEGDRYYIHYNDGDVEWTTAVFIRRP